MIQNISTIFIREIFSEKPGQETWALERLEPSEGKLSCSVLMGAWVGNSPCLPDPSFFVNTFDGYTSQSVKFTAGPVPCRLSSQRVLVALFHGLQEAFYHKF